MVETTAAILIRAWFEDELGPDALRARIRTAGEITGAPRLDRVVVSEAEILEAIRSWLRSFANSAGDGRVTLDE
jgi:hypothetical protein